MIKCSCDVCGNDIEQRAINQNTITIHLGKHLMLEKHICHKCSKSTQSSLRSCFEPTRKVVAAPSRSLPEVKAKTPMPDVKSPRKPALPPSRKSEDGKCLSCQGTGNVAIDIGGSQSVSTCPSCSGSGQAKDERLLLRKGQKRFSIYEIANLFLDHRYISVGDLMVFLTTPDRRPDGCTAICRSIVLKQHPQLKPLASLDPNTIIDPDKWRRELIEEYGEELILVTAKEEK